MMANKHEIHYNILAAQVETLFTYYNRSKLPSWIIGEFEPMVVDGRPIISFLVEVDPKSEARRKITIKVVVEDRTIKFFNNYNFGVSVGGGILLWSDKEPPEKNLIDIEYALSIATEHLAGQIAKHLE